MATLKIFLKKITLKGIVQVKLPRLENSSKNYGNWHVSSRLPFPWAHSESMNQSELGIMVLATFLNME